MKLADIFGMWKSVEILTHSSAQQIDPRDKISPVYGVSMDDANGLPWEFLPSLSENSPHQWQFHGHCGIYRVDLINELVCAKLDPTNVYPGDIGNSFSRLFDLSFDHKGLPIANSFSISMAAWASSVIVTAKDGLNCLLRNDSFRSSGGFSNISADVESVNSGHRVYDELIVGYREWLLNETHAMKEGGRVADIAWVQNLIRNVCKSINFPGDLIECCHSRIRASRVNKHSASPGEDANENITSLFLEDLQRTESSCIAGNLGKGMEQYLASYEDRAHERVDVRDCANNQTTFNLLRPEVFPVGRWPAEHSLTYSQQLAVNFAWKGLSETAGLIGVNGPPGTGKTTLLRDLVAAVVTQRAIHLSRLNIGKFGPRKLVRIGDVMAPYYPLHESLQGHSIVVASSNNGAVENISLALPAAESVPAPVSASTKYFQETAQKVCGREAWALIAAALGKKSNRSKFLTNFWWGDRKLAAGEKLAEGASLRQHFMAIRDRSKEPRVIWESALRNFKIALEREQALRAQVQGWSKLNEQIVTVSYRRLLDEAALNGIEETIKKKTQMLEVMDQKLLAQYAELTLAKDVFERMTAELTQIHKAKPSLIKNLLSLGKCKREWASTSKEMIERHSSHERQMITLNEVYKQHRDARDAFNDGLQAEVLRKAQFARQIKTAHKTLVGLQEDVMIAKDALGNAWVDVDADTTDREHCEPWALNDWTTARENVFERALELHQAFLEAHPQQVLANLNLVSDWLGGKRLPADVAKHALDALCLIVPVVSTTFASTPRMFADLPRESIGWLLVDEGGQALASHAAGAVWRAKRTVIIGDPLQLEPVLGLSPAIVSVLCKMFDVKCRLSTCAVSAQHIADTATRIGTYVPSQDGATEWVGLPLRLHRRCAEPMFSISNKIAYGGMMVNAKREAKSSFSTTSAWVHVDGAAGEFTEHWSAEEARVLSSLLQQLIDAGVARNQIGLVSPFRSCARKLKEIAQVHQIPTDKVGTVHTAQGKEADVIVLVLGGNPQKPGAITWAASKPNMLNVAVTRAKKSIFVVGDRHRWATQKYYSVLSDLMPENEDSINKSVKM